MIHEDFYNTIIDSLLQSDTSISSLVSHLLNPLVSEKEIWPEDYHRIMSLLLSDTAKEKLVKDLVALAENDNALILVDELLGYEEFKKLHNIDTTDTSKAYVLATKRDYIHLLKITPKPFEQIQSEILDITEVFFTKWKMALMNQAYPINVVLSGLGLCINLGQLEEIAKDISKLNASNNNLVSEDLLVKAMSTIISSTTDAIGFKIGEEEIIMSISRPDNQLIFKSSFSDAASLYDTVEAIMGSEKTKEDMGKWLEETL